MMQDEKNLDLLAIFHYIVGGMTALFACIPFIHVAMGIMMVNGRFVGKEPVPPWLGWILIAVGSFFILCGLALAVAMIISGRRLKARKSRIYCIVVAAIECMLMPFGTVLGIFTIIILMKDSVVELFAAQREDASGAAMAKQE